MSNRKMCFPSIEFSAALLAAYHEDFCVVVEQIEKSTRLCSLQATVRTIQILAVSPHER